MSTLSDTQVAALKQAAKRKNRLVEPLPKAIPSKSHKRVIQGLLKRELIEQHGAQRIISRKGYEAINAPYPGKLTKLDTLQGLLSQKNGITIDEAAHIIGWTPQAVRGAISGVMIAKRGLSINSTKSSGQPRYYFIEANA